MESHYFCCKTKLGNLVKCHTKLFVLHMYLEFHRTLIHNRGQKVICW